MIDMQKTIYGFVGIMAALYVTLGMYIRHQEIEIERMNKLNLLMGLDVSELQYISTKG